MTNMKMDIIPAIDIIEGKCVRLTQGDFSQKKVYNEYPLEVAKAFEDAGLTRLHLVDLDGARTGSVKNWKVLEQLAGKTGLTIDFGGGIKTTKDADIVLNSGARWATVGSIAVTDERLFHDWILFYGANRFFLGADVKEEKLAIHGWQETSEKGIYDFLGQWLDQGIRYAFCTDVSKDGLLQGSSIELYTRIREKFKDLRLVASGGVKDMEEVYALQQLGCAGVIIGKALYEGRIALAELAQFLTTKA